MPDVSASPSGVPLREGDLPRLRILRDVVDPPFGGVKDGIVQREGLEGAQSPAGVQERHEEVADEGTREAVAADAAVHLLLQIRRCSRSARA